VESGSKGGGVFDGGGSGSQGGVAAVYGGIQAQGFAQGGAVRAARGDRRITHAGGIVLSYLSTWRKQRERGELAPGYQLTSAVLASGRKTP
jgi:hypothetical protein